MDYSDIDMSFVSTDATMTTDATTVVELTTIAEPTIAKPTIAKPTVIETTPQQATMPTSALMSSYIANLFDKPVLDELRTTVNVIELKASTGTRYTIKCIDTGKDSRQSFLVSIITWDTHLRKQLKDKINRIVPRAIEDFIKSPLQLFVVKNVGQFKRFLCVLYSLVRVSDEHQDAIKKWLGTYRSSAMAREKVYH